MPPRTEDLTAQFANGTLNNDGWRPDRDHSPAWLQERCQFWQRQLRLSDWELIITYATSHELGRDYAHTNVNAALKEARVRIMDPTDADAPSTRTGPYDVE